MRSPSGLLFDLDGTLLDTARDLGNALNYVLANNQLPICSYEQYRQVASHGTNGLLDLGFGDKLADYNVERLRSELLDYYYANICVDTVLFDGVHEVIEAMDAVSLPWGIVTNKPGWLTDALLPNFKSFANCKVVVSGDSIAQRKPDPAPLLLAAETIGTKPGDIWYIGDAERDIQAANAAEMTSVLADYGYIGDADKPEDWRADMSIEHASSLISHISG